MKISKEVLLKTYEEIKKGLKRDEEEFNKRLSALQLAAKNSAVSTFMQQKKELMLSIVASLPVRTWECPFCAVHFYLEKCEECPYGKKHGICTGKKKLSDYQKLMNAKKKLQSAIQNYHIAGDNYNA